MNYTEENVLTRIERWRESVIMGWLDAFIAGSNTDTDMVDDQRQKILGKLKVSAQNYLIF